MPSFDLRAEPINNTCVSCPVTILPKTERNYIVWDRDHKDVEGKRIGAWRRQCARCHDREGRLRG